MNDPLTVPSHLSTPSSRAPVSTTKSLLVAPGEGSTLSLHAAVRAGDHAQVVALLNEGYSVRERDHLGSTPLHLAMGYGQVEIALSLIDAGASLSSRAFFNRGDRHTLFPYGLTPVDVAILNGQVNVLDAVWSSEAIQVSCSQNAPQRYQSQGWFVIALYAVVHQYEEYVRFPSQPNHQALINTLDVYETYLSHLENPFFYNGNDQVPISVISKYSVYDLLSTIDDPLVAEKASEILARFESQNDLFAQYVQTKLLAHALALSGTLTFEWTSFDGSEVESYDVFAEGFFGTYTTEKFARVASLFVSHHKAFTSLYDGLYQTIEDQFSFASTLADLQSKGLENAQYQTAYERFTEGEIVLLPSGWPGHYINVILDPVNELFLICNNGHRHRSLPSGVTVYHIDNMDAINLETLHTILNGPSDYHIQYGLYYDLNLTLVDVIDQPNQTVGNCSWQSHAPAFEGIVYLHFLRKGYMPESAKAMAKAHYTYWDSYLTKQLVNFYFTHHDHLDTKSILKILTEHFNDALKGASCTNVELSTINTIIRSLSVPKHRAALEEMPQAELAELYAESPQIALMWYRAGLWPLISEAYSNMNKLGDDELQNHTTYIEATQEVALYDFLDETDDWGLPTDAMELINYDLAAELTEWQYESPVFTGGDSNQKPFFVLPKSIGEGGEDAVDWEQIIPPLPTDEEDSDKVNEETKESDAEASAAFEVTAMAMDSVIDSPIDGATAPLLPKSFSVMQGLPFGTSFNDDGATVDANEHPDAHTIELSHVLGDVQVDPLDSLLNALDTQASDEGDAPIVSVAPEMTAAFDVAPFHEYAVEPNALPELSVSEVHELY